MRRLLMFMIACLIGNALYAQAGTPDLSWTFQWDGARYGLLFEADGLSPGIRNAVRNDIEQVCRFNARAGALFHAYVPGDANHGKYAGSVSLGECYAFIRPSEGMSGGKSTLRRVPIILRPSR